MSVAFWSAEVSKGKPVEVQPPEGYVLNLQQAAITSDKDNASAIVKAKTTAIEAMLSLQSWQLLEVKHVTNFH